MRSFPLFYLSLITLISGILFYGWYHEIIIISYPIEKNVSIKNTSSSQDIVLYFWQQGAWTTEKQSCLFPASFNDYITSIINALLLLLYSEEILNKKVYVETALLTQDRSQIYLSFNRLPFNKEDSTWKKIVIIEGILKTLKENITAIKGVFFLVNHVPINDSHLEFSRAWPIEGCVQ